MKTVSAEDIQEFVRRKTVKSRAGCWLWGGDVGVYGYGVVSGLGKGHRLAHRASYTAFKGPIPAGMHVDHLCRVRLCCNPEHLEAVTPAENIARARAFEGARHVSVRQSSAACLLLAVMSGNENAIAYIEKLKAERAALASTPQPTGGG